MLQYSLYSYNTYKYMFNFIKKRYNSVIFQSFQFRFPVEYDISCEQLMEGGQDPKLTWKILEANITNYNPIKKECRLCIREKFNIALKPHLATLNSRNEMFAHCRHMEAKLIKKPPD